MPAEGELVPTPGEADTRPVIAATADILDAVRGYVWIVLAAIVVWRLFPVIKLRFSRGTVTFKIAGQEVTFQEASTQLSEYIDDLRTRIIALEERLQDASGSIAPERVPAAEPAASAPARILWVDDRPENNAFLIKSLQDRGVVVAEAMSTDDALAKLESGRRAFDVVVSDMGRTERGHYNPLAGVDLVRRLRDLDPSLPVVIYASRNAVERGGTAARDAGAAGVTSSPTELLRTLRIGPTTAFEDSVAKLVRRELDASPFPIRGAVDLVAERGGERIGIEIKNWSRQPSSQDFRRVLDELAAVRERYAFDRIIMVTRPGIQVPADVDLPAWLTVVPEDELLASLQR